MKKTAVIFFFFLLTFFGALGAQEFQFEGYFDYFGGIEPRVGYENLRTQLYMSPRFSGYSDSSGLEWVLSGKLWVQPLGEPQSIDPWDILGETYLFLPAGNFDFILGNKIVTYGFADVFGPLNAPHGSNKAAYSMDEKYDARRADPLLQVKFYPSFYDTIELTYVPVTRPDKERQDDVFLEDTKDTVNWYDKPYIVEEAGDFHSVFLDYTRYGERADIQFFYGFYTDNTPDFQIEDVSSSMETEITTEYNRKQTFGVAYATRLGNSTLSQDAAFNLTDNLDGSDLGGQYSDITLTSQYLVNLPGNILSQTALVYSYFFNHGNYESEADEDAAEYLSTEIRNFHLQPQQHIAFFVFHFEKSFLRERLKTQLNAAYTFSPNVYLGPRIALSLSDLWTLESGADITLFDPADQDLRRNPSNDNYYVRMIFRY